MTDRNIKKLTDKMKKALDGEKKDYAKNLLRIAVKEREIFKTVDVDLFTDLMYLVFTEEQIADSDIVICQGMGEWHSYFIDEFNDMIRGKKPDNNPLFQNKMTEEALQEIRNIVQKTEDTVTLETQEEKISFSKIGNKNAQKTGFFAKNIVETYKKSEDYKELIKSYTDHYKSVTGSIDQQLIDDMALIKVRQKHLWKAKSSYLHSQQLKALEDLDIATRATNGKIPALPQNAQRLFIKFKDLSEEEWREAHKEAGDQAIHWGLHHKAAEKIYMDFLDHYMENMSSMEMKRYNHKKRFVMDRLAFAKEKLDIAETELYALCGVQAVWDYVEKIQWVGTGHWKDFEREEGRLQRAFEAKKRLLDGAVREKRQAAKLDLSFSRVLVKEAKKCDYAFDLPPLLEKMEGYLKELMPDLGLKQA